MKVRHTITEEDIFEGDNCISKELASSYGGGSAKTFEIIAKLVRNGDMLTSKKIAFRVNDRGTITETNSLKYALEAYNNAP